MSVEFELVDAVEDDGNPTSIQITATLEANRLYVLFVESSALVANLRDPTVDSPNETWEREGGTLTLNNASRVSAWRCMPTTQRVNEVISIPFNNPTSQAQTGAAAILVEGTGIPDGNNGDDAIVSGSFSNSTTSPGNTTSISHTFGALDEPGNRILAAVLCHANEQQDNPPDSGDSVQIAAGWHANPLRSLAVYLDDDNVVDASWTSTVAGIVWGFEVIEDIAAPQKLRPAADSVDGTWTNQAGNNTDMFDSINEESPSASDYIQSVSGPTTVVHRQKLETGGDPSSSSGHIIRFRAFKEAAGGGTIQLTVQIRQGGGDVAGGGTLIAQTSVSDLPETDQQYTYTLSGAEADSITAYGDLYVEFHANQT